MKELNQQCLAELQLAVLKTLLKIMNDPNVFTKDRLKAAELLSKISPTIFKENE